jgi:hypothetical protein
MTGLTKLRIMVPFEKKAESLEALSQLQHLTVDYEVLRWQPRGPVFPLVIPDAARITELHWNAYSHEVGKKLSHLVLRSSTNKILKGIIRKEGCMTLLEACIVGHVWSGQAYHCSRILDVRLSILRSRWL